MVCHRLPLLCAAIVVLVSPLTDILMGADHENTLVRIAYPDGREL